MHADTLHVATHMALHILMLGSAITCAVCAFLGQHSAGDRVGAILMLAGMTDMAVFGMARALVWTALFLMCALMLAPRLRRSTEPGGAALLRYLAMVASAGLFAGMATGIHEETAAHRPAQSAAVVAGHHGTGTTTLVADVFGLTLAGAVAVLVFAAIVLTRLARSRTRRRLDVMDAGSTSLMLGAMAASAALA